MIGISPRIASGHTARYDRIPMRRVFGFFVYHPEKTCPRCGSMHVHRTKRGRILEYWVLFFIDVRPYRCGKCRLRFYGPKKFSDDKDPHDEADIVAYDNASQQSPPDPDSPRTSRH
ncbi:MAG: hypothetical protein JWN92_2532 [Candidatus Acidoferrum typicum]|nr:hypothetical protein [Candidatus Acidoferrum typicum]